MTQSILITGCSTGIGYHCAHFLHNKGYRVIASCRHLDDVQRLIDEGLICIQLDLQNTDSIHSAVEKVKEITGGRLDVLFNNGAYGQPGALEDLPTSALRTQFETNFFGWHELTQQILPMMLKQGEGKIIQNSSILGLVAMKYRGAYNASKFAIEGYTDTLRLELDNTKIHISLIEPGPIHSAFRSTAKLQFEEKIQYKNSRHNKAYQETLARLSAPKSTNKFTLPPDAISDIVLKILTSSHPKARYYVTKPTYIFGTLRRILPTVWLDKLLTKSH